MTHAPTMPCPWCDVCDRRAAQIAELKAQLDEANFEAARQRHACAEAKARLVELEEGLT